MDGTSYGINFVSLEDFALTDATLENNVLHVNLNGKAKAVYNADYFQNASRHLRMHLKYTGAGLDTNYQSNATIVLCIKYKIEKGSGEVVYKYEHVTCGVNRWESIEEDGQTYYIDNTYIETLGYEIEQIEICVHTIATYGIGIYELEVCQGYNVETVTTAEEVAYFTSISAEVAKINTLYANDIIAEQIETNFKDRLPHNPMPKDNIRQYFSIYENEQEYREDTLSSEEKEQYKISNVTVYYNLLSFDIIKGTDNITNVNLDRNAYSKTDPITRIKNGHLYSETLKKNIREAAAVWVRKTLYRTVKKRDTDGKISLNGTLYNTPVTILGAGNTVEYTGPSFGITLNDGKFYNDQVVEWKDSKGKHTVFLKDNKYIEQLANEDGINLGGGTITSDPTDTIIFHDASDTIELRKKENITVWAHTKDSEWDYLTNESDTSKVVKYKSISD